MQSFQTTTESSSPLYTHSSFFLRGDDDTTQNPTLFWDIQRSFQQQDAVDLSSSCSFSPGSAFGAKSSDVAVLASNLQCATFNTNIGGGCASTGEVCIETGQEPMFQRGTIFNAVPLGNENWGDSGMADNSQQTEDTSTDVDTDDKNQCFSNVSWYNGVQQEPLVVVMDSKDQSKAKVKDEDQKTLRRLVQNREAARKSRLRKKAYVQQLENSRVRLAQMEQELQRDVSGITGDHAHSVVANGVLAFDMDYARWVDEHQHLINGIRSAINSQMVDKELHLLVDGVMAHYDELCRLKSIGAKADIFHMLSGMWKTPVERCFMWLGGYRSSELLKIVRNHLEQLTDQQLIGIYNLQQSSQQAEDALSQGMEALQQSLSETLSSTSLGPTCSGNVAEYMGQMAIAMAKLASLESFLHQADLLRQQTMHQLQRILTTNQAARALVVINDFISRLRALNSLWSACPKEY
ncbi:transcription factor TGA2.2-like isoform X2 [Lotus japonicus]|uniref:transcription factor TGA2.2-like isoform X2 n=1 Tax=Lotus japonicus TaxID=34305 RepID=UPI00258E1D82|nr:transcription factor TGA2.2-like isoform X2 [Lotus japonicus]